MIVVKEKMGAVIAKFKDWEELEEYRDVIKDDDIIIER